MSELNGQPGEVHLTIQIKRKETGNVETYDLVGKIAQEEHEEKDNGSNPQHSGS